MFIYNSIGLITGRGGGKDFKIWEYFGNDMFTVTSDLKVDLTLLVEQYYLFIFNIFRINHGCNFDDPYKLVTISKKNAFYRYFQRHLKFNTPDHIALL